MNAQFADSKSFPRAKVATSGTRSRTTQLGRVDRRQTDVSNFAWADVEALLALTTLVGIVSYIVFAV
ncbi:MAG TPA: hypothetical protein VGX76_21150 [Pirellulales bacterium]|jgi:hypothetical protein|nr:hypothetical protein [Pirellulales bacterium]